MLLRIPRKMLRCAIALLLLGVATAKLVKFTPCLNAQELCTVSDVDITPCQSPSRCRLEKNQTTNLSFDFTPKFSSATLKTGVYFVNSDTEMGFSDLGPDACVYTSCPTVADTKQTFTYSLYIGKRIPSGLFPIRWRVWDETDNSKMCCFNINIKIAK
uniref:Niemann Pick type C n=1 Tax=Histia rhodope TaxID=1453155 RepID=A0A6M3YCE9_9NEOP|nr:Niemann Pick type C [Histia rhodope]